MDISMNYIRMCEMALPMIGFQEYSTADIPEQRWLKNMYALKQSGPLDKYAIIAADKRPESGPEMAVIQVYSQDQMQEYLHQRYRKKYDTLVLVEDFRAFCEAMSKAKRLPSPEPSLEQLWLGYAMRMAFDMYWHGGELVWLDWQADFVEAPDTMEGSGEVV